MATITQCDRCGTLDGVTESAHVRGLPVDLCTACADEMFDHAWLNDIIAATQTVPATGRNGRIQRSPRHGFTAAAIEASQDPSREIAPAEG